jgi:ABC-type multidrug transport system fused ATPase/permease subunit
MNGCDIRSLQQGEYRRQFGVVNQDCLLFHTTIRENIVLGRRYDEGVLKRACEIANILEFIEGLPAGMDTIVGERGVRLSGGQRQRIAIARAVYERPQILVLDEATSSLDTESERLVQRAIERALEETTGVVIAHRLSTIAQATKIVVMNMGQIEAVGQHEELIKHSTTYRRLQNLQGAVC